MNTPAAGISVLFPVLRTDHPGLPPATVITAGLNPLRFEGAAYEQKLTSAGVQVNFRNYPGVTHKFFGMGAVLDEANQAISQAAQGLLRAFGN